MRGRHAPLKTQVPAVAHAPKRAAFTARVNASESVKPVRTSVTTARKMWVRYGDSSSGACADYKVVSARSVSSRQAYEGYPA